LSAVEEDGEDVAEVTSSSVPVSEFDFGDGAGDVVLDSEDVDGQVLDSAAVAHSSLPVGAELFEEGSELVDGVVAVEDHVLVLLEGQGDLDDDLGEVAVNGLADDGIDGADELVHVLGALGGGVDGLVQADGVQEAESESVDVLPEGAVLLKVRVKLLVPLHVLRELRLEVVISLVGRDGQGQDAKNPLCLYHFHVQVKMSSKKNGKKKGYGLIKLSGNRGSTEWLQLGEDNYYFQDGATYDFLVTSKVELTDINQIDFKWKDDAAFWEIDQWELGSPSIYLSKISVFSGEFQYERNFCDTDDKLKSGSERRYAKTC